MYATAFRKASCKFPAPNMERHEVYREKAVRFRRIIERRHILGPAEKRRFYKLMRKYEAFCFDKVSVHKAAGGHNQTAGRREGASLRCRSKRNVFSTCDL